MAEMTEPTNSAKDAAAIGLRVKMPGLRRVLVVIAIVELLFGLWRLPVLFGRVSILIADPFEPEPGLGGLIIKAYAASRPLLALAALVLAARGRTRHAIVLLGAAEMVRWLNLMPGLAQYGLPFGDALNVQWTATQIFIFPLTAVCGIALAARDRRARLATLLVSMPILYNLLALTVIVIMALINGS